MSNSSFLYQISQEQKEDARNLIVQIFCETKNFFLINKNKMDSYVHMKSENSNVSFTQYILSIKNRN
jgi:hypothetical protein